MIARPTSKVGQNGLDIFFITLCLAISAAGGVVASQSASASTAQAMATEASAQ